MNTKNTRKKILIIRFSSIGDIVLTTPVLRCLKEQQTEVEIHYLTKKSFVDLVAHNPHVDAVFSFEKDLNEVLPALLNEQYDWVIDLHNNLRSRIITSRLKTKVKRFNKLNISKWLLVNFKLNLLPKIHVVDRYLETLRSLNVKDDKKGLEFYFPPNTILPEQLHHKNYLALVIGGTHQTKKFPVDKLISLCNSTDKLVVLLGAKGELEDAQKIISNTKQNIINFCGQLSLFESAKVIEYAELVITNDTGLMHIAAAFQKKIISIWGNTVPELGMYPLLQKKEENIIVEMKGLPCRPCSKIGFSKCPKGHFNCMNRIDEKSILIHIE